MSKQEQRYPYEYAYAIAIRVLEELRPFCKRIEIAGSLRRKKKDIGDIELIICPLPYSIGLFEDGLASVVNKWPKVRGILEYGKTKSTQRILPEGIKLDLFMAEEGNWGSILAIRTGSGEFTRRVLACGWSRLGFTGDGGYLYKNGIKYGFSEEKELFDFLGIQYIEPKNRDY